MGMVAGRTDEEWAHAIADAYAAQTKPPLTVKLREQVSDQVGRAIRGCNLLEPSCAERVNQALDSFERRLDAAVGPRIVAINARSGTIEVRYRSEAGQPNRAFGGQ